jgi:hypothetical protein
MNAKLTIVIDLISPNLSVGSVLQNIIFYSLISLLIGINIVIINRKRDFKKTTQDTDTQNGHNSYIQISRSSYNGLLQRGTALEAENSSLTLEILSLGEELELSLKKSDMLNDQLSDISNCVDLTICYDEHLGDWSIDAITQELSFSDYGLWIHGYQIGKKLTWMESLEVVDEEYRKQIETSFILSLTTGTDFSMIYKIKSIDESHARWVRSFGRVKCNSHGAPIRLEGKLTLVPIEA